MEREELKLLQLRNQHLLFPADVLKAVRELCGMQAQFLSNALHAIAIRSSAPAATDGLVKSWAMRGTMHVFAEADLPLILHEGRTHFLRPCDTLLADAYCTAARKRELTDLLLRCIDAGICERDALKEALFAEGMSEEEAKSAFDPWGGLIRALCEKGEICHIVQEKKAYRRCLPFTPMEKEEAQLELARRYFMHYGPATIKDAAYFFAAPQKAVRVWLDALPVKSEECDGRTYFYVENGGALQKELPDCILLAGFDPLLMGYEKTESLYLRQENLRTVFTLSGIVRPTVLLRGEIAAVWKRKNKTLELTPFRPLTAEEYNAISDEAERLWAEGMRIKSTNHDLA